MLLSYWSANRDEDVFDDPFRFDVGRTPNKHLAFGFGVHYCLGALLARMEIKALLDELLPRLDTIDLAGPTELTASVLVNGPKRMPVSLPWSDGRVLHELGFYTLAGPPQSPASWSTRWPRPRRWGSGRRSSRSATTSRRRPRSPAPSGAVSERLGIATAATNHNTRHPIVTAGYARTMHRLTGGRFALGLGRGIAAMLDAYGMPRITTAQMEDFAGLMRRLLRGEAIVGHDGPAGQVPDPAPRRRARRGHPAGLVAFGPNSLALGGRAFDEVVLHTFFTDETMARCVQTVKDGGRGGRPRPDVGARSGRASPPSATTSPRTSASRRRSAASATYLQGYGDLLVRTNGWDPAVLERFRADHGDRRRSAGHRRRRHHRAARAHRHADPRRVAGGARHRHARAVRRAIRGQFDLGCDGVILHGATPAELAPIVDAYRCRSGMTTTRTTYCRLCEVGCGLVANVEDGRITRVHPDKDHPVTAGFACRQERPACGRRSSRPRPCRPSPAPHRGRGSSTRRGTMHSTRSPPG